MAAVVYDLPSEVVGVSGVIPPTLSLLAGVDKAEEQRLAAGPQILRAFLELRRECDLRCLDTFLPFPLPSHNSPTPPSSPPFIGESLNLLAGLPLQWEWDLPSWRGSVR